MKNIFAILLCISCIVLFGCTSINTVDQETYEIIKNYHEAVGSKCFEYLKNDSSISPRTLNTFKTYDELMIKTIKSLKVEK